MVLVGSPSAHPTSTPPSEGHLGGVGETGNIGQTNYTASKSGLFGMTKTLAREAAAELAQLGKRTDDGIGITVNAVTVVA
ncbi:hypothetical protein [Rhodococcus opacus]|uniref:hypothetical protein n=1 Tax=Rhodococcus opacus TaxID=37919 RepID=UPI0022364BC8|nr:hypothetical protein [Rhodococcus opacus]UZG55267.1 hypothetical protein ONE62_35440 [Rhodococcus opacus]